MNEPPPIAESRYVRRAGILIILLAMGLSTGRLMSSGPLKSANDRSRWCTVWSLAERGTYQIDEARAKPGWDTIDLVKHEGHFYSTKPPLLPWLVTQLYRGLRLATGWTLDTHLLRVTRTLLFLVNILPMAVALLLWRGMIARYVPDAWAQLVVVTLLAGGTMLSPFLSVFNNHTVGATSLMLGVWALERIYRNEFARWAWVVSGLSLGFLVCNELPAASLSGLVFLGLWAKSPRRTWGLFVTAALVPMAMFFWTNYEATGGWRPFYSYYGTEKYRFVHEGIPSYWMDPKGVDRNIDSFPVYLLHCTIGHHGWFSLTPAFLWTMLSWLVPRWRRAICWPGHLGGITAVVSLLVFGFYLQKTENYNFGGVSVALRWMLWLAPLWALVMLPVVEALCRRWPGRLAVLVTLAASIYSVWMPVDGPWKQSWLFTRMTEWGWIDYSDPKPALPHPMNSWLYRLPHGNSIDDKYWVEFIAGTGASRETLMLRDAGPGTRGADSTTLTRWIEWVWNAGLPNERTIRMELAVQAFEQGLPLEQCLVSPTAGPQREVALRELAGLPQPTPYASSAIKYLRTGLRKDAIRTHLIYGYTPVRQSNGTIQHLTRNVFLSEEIPFGVVQFEIQTRTLPTAKPTSNRRFWVSKAGMWVTPPPGWLPRRNI